ncbi:MAG TPA: glycosyltransferase family 2 protein [Parafilimonas sp.]|nr:glycosyltransferase family 2 protein [Parafilimonas sp.]
MKISVAMATYNGGKYIGKQLQSIIEQLDDNSEIIISDDGSTDNTISVIRSFNDKRIKVIYNPAKGVIKNFENALRNATGDIIFLSDQDDEWMPGKVNLVKKYLEKYDFIVSDCFIVNDEGEILQNSIYSLKKSGAGIIKNLKSNNYVGCCMAFKKDILAVALPFPQKIPMHDIWLGFIADVLFKPRFITEKLVLYRRHSGNATYTSSKSGFNLYQKIKFRINIVRYLPLLLVRKMRISAK